MIRRPPRSTLSSSSAASDVYKRQATQRANLLIDQVLREGDRHVVSITAIDLVAANQCRLDAGGRQAGVEAGDGAGDVDRGTWSRAGDRECRGRRLRVLGAYQADLRVLKAINLDDVRGQTQ